MLTRLRGLWRAARSQPLLRPLLSAVDRLWWKRTIRRAQIVDVDFVSWQLGRPVSARAALRAYVQGGFADGLSLNPLFAEAVVSRQLPDADRVPAMYAYLVTDASGIETIPAWDAPAYAAEHPDATTAPGGPVGYAWRRLRDGSPVRLRGGNDVDHRRLLAAASGGAPDAAPRIASLMLWWELDGRDADGEGLRAALGLLDECDRPSGTEEPSPDAAALVLDVSFAPQPVRIQAALLAAGDPRIQMVDIPAGTEEARATLPEGTTLVRRERGAWISEPGLRALLHEAVSGPVAPLWADTDGTVASAGVIAGEGDAYRVLAGFPVEDALAQGAQIEVDAVDAPIRAHVVGVSGPPRTVLRSTVIAAARGDETTLLDAARDRLLPVPAPRGFTVSGWDRADGAVRPRLSRDSTTAFLADGREVPRLRWAIKTSAPAGPRGESWGDTHFARGLAAALERLGQFAAVDARPAARRSTAGFDDVSLVLRGPHEVHPPDTATTILWIISHPDEIEPTELAPFDLVFAASTRWAAEASRRFGTPIAPLLQCTDATRFRPHGATRTEDLVFVGTARGIARPAVVEPLKAGAPVRVYGPDWRGYIPAAAIAGTHVPNQDLPSLYERAGAVLNDHWPAMQREGFVSNRLFDVIASGGRAISDHVAGINEIFGASVRTYTSVPELHALALSRLDDLFPSERELASIARRIREQHSFDARAAELLAAVLRTR